jgi:hypothetical protein
MQVRILTECVSGTVTDPHIRLRQVGFVLLDLSADAGVVTLRIICCCFDNRAGIISPTTAIPEDCGTEEDKYQEYHRVIHLFLLASKHSMKEITHSISRNGSNRWE